MEGLRIGDGCGMKPDLRRVGNIAMFNSGGTHPSRLRQEAVSIVDTTGAPIAPDEVLDFMQTISEGNILQPGLDAGYHFVEEIGAFSVSTTDAMAPPTNNPDVFGRIAALHVMSDLWVAGVIPKTMQQYLVLPRQLDEQVLSRVLQGFKDICDQFGATITGGHTRQEGDEYLVGGTATGYASKRFDINKPRVGDLIVTTKALGTSVVIAAHKIIQQGHANGLPVTADETIRATEVSMTTDNHIAVEMRQEHLVTSCTDITGFGLMGHLSNLVNPVGKGAVIEIDQLPLIDKAYELLEKGVHTHAGDDAQIHYATRQKDRGLLLDPRFHFAFLPETSGGILATVRPERYDFLKGIVEEAGQTLTIIGEVTPRHSIEQDDYRFAGIALR